ncbi:NADH-quinone oxidoreductase subunit L [Parasphingopyxis sp. CP4]|uniref:NADH-quinone oxidoreductase subunit L n=1 Tax=Parasphingopyxis sp. CP4 TaxID=2724527 RepID=UPI0015A162BB|nr:NADH-quinone oxidoreductase subunit L [Parasphingopyxis sp. CP4]QLC21683.1 NADH-quinone oxidoreductase subunit L [Parasphingopyxis sp. CP4]
MIQLIVFLPLLAAIIAGLGNRALGNFTAKILTTGVLFAGCALSWIIFMQFMAGGQEAYVAPVFDWIRSGDMDVAWSLRVDTLTAVMLVVVTTVSALVHLYSWGYMAEDPDQPRFFAYLSLFTFAMLMLVTSNNLVQMFFGWEGVGLASYLLIGFWYKKPSANAAAIKAFVVNRVGDFGFSLGIFGTFVVFGTVSIPEILEAAPAMAGSTIGFLGYRVDTMTLLCLLLFVGAMGKSAQFGLHTWLPDAMEGPTPVSALIHAATMVTAGVFMVCRLSPMFETSDVALTVVVFFGMLTAFFAATVGTAQMDIKRVIAYSTCSQLGYMFVAAGLGAYGIAMFHLFTHAFFKALLFLGAGSVIHAMHHEQDMQHYGALRKEIPFTFWAMVIGTLAITGVGIVGVFGFAGFYSKDLIIEAAFVSDSSLGGVAFFTLVFAALLTSFYSWRLIFMTFFGKARWITSEHIQHAVHDHGDDSHDDAPEGTGGYHPHESPWSMLIPLAVLSIGAIFAGYLFYYPFGYAEQGEIFWAGSIALDTHLLHAIHEVPTWVKYAPGAVMLTGLAIAWLAYIRYTDWPRRFVDQFRVLHAFLYNKWYIDELYDVIFVRPSFAIGRFLWKRGDKGFIDRFGPDGVSGLVAVGSGFARRFQSGYLYSYALVMLIGIAAATTWAITR